MNGQLGGCARRGCGAQEAPRGRYTASACILSDTHTFQMNKVKVCVRDPGNSGGVEAASGRWGVEQGAAGAQASGSEGAWRPASVRTRAADERVMTGGGLCPCGPVAATATWCQAPLGTEKPDV